MRASGDTRIAKKCSIALSFGGIPQIKLGGRLTNRRLGCHPCHSPESMTLSQAP